MRKILLLICIAFVVVCYGYPCLVLPFGEYTYTTKVADQEITSTIKFNFKKKATWTIGDLSATYNYKLKGNEVVLSLDDTFDNEDDVKLSISSIYRLGEYNNQIGLWTTIGVGVAALVLVITIPKKD
ncbi:MAG: hypothetical protein IKM43_02345 [Clostridia bacterium]|nr:hypothetical protein [Clostridia bacterium]